MSRALLVTSLALLAVGVAAASDSGDTSVQAVIEARQAGFKKMGAAMKSIATELKTDAPDLAKLTAPAQAIALGAKEQPAWFPAGSGPESGLETDALAHIWKDGAKFGSLSTQLGIESGKLTSALAGQDVAAVRTQFKVLADVCATCHKSFRAD
jgi:cytochrome c556